MPYADQCLPNGIRNILYVCGIFYLNVPETLEDQIIEANGSQRYLSLIMVASNISISIQYISKYSNPSLNQNS